MAWPKRAKVAKNSARTDVAPAARIGAATAQFDRAVAARRSLGVAAFGLAILDATTGQARTKPIDGVRLPTNAIPTTSGDSYQDGRGLLAAGDMPGAIAAFRAALITAPQSIDALNGVAVAYDRIGRYDVSRSYYDTALAIDPDAALVLNNLGYSLYLQGKFEAAIPLLQKAAASNDDGARAAGQRVLTLIAARMREAKIASADIDVEVAASVPAPQARIEVSSNGEQRLVLAAPAPPRELAARLGDDAELVMVAKPWMAKDDAIVLARAMAAAQAEVAARSTLAANTGAINPLRTRHTPPTAPAPKSDRPNDPTIVALVVDDAPSGTAMAGSASHLATIPAAVATTATAADTAAAWLIAPRRNVRPTDTVVVGHEPKPDAGQIAFDSDDGDLNAFAARMQGIDQAAAVPVSTAEAVARLEALILRVRTA
jgi:tetratricopeptide (TPR) repeat protein